MTPTVATLQSALEQAWDKDTSTQPDDWSSADPTLGQCAVTALVVHDYLGGAIVRCRVAGTIADTHYYNLLKDGTVIDLTLAQFPPDVAFVEKVLTVSGNSVRDYALSYPKTNSRYQLLAKRVQDILNALEN